MSDDQPNGREPELSGARPKVEVVLYFSATDGYWVLRNPDLPVLPAEGDRLFLPLPVGRFLVMVAKCRCVSPRYVEILVLPDTVSDCVGYPYGRAMLPAEVVVSLQHAGFRLQEETFRAR